MKHEKEDKIIVSWWNGGGKLIPRLKVNPELIKFMATEPDVFAYGESLVFRSSRDMCLPGYNAITHRAQKEGMRRGIVVY